VNRFESPRHPGNELARYSRQRDIEAPMIGACYLTEWAPGLDQLFDLETEIAVYRNESELAETLRRLLADPKQRESLRQAGQKRALADHSIAITLKKIRRHLGIRDQHNATQ
jgi:spore maturation protein CgeB